MMDQSKLMLKNTVLLMGSKPRLVLSTVNYSALSVFFIGYLKALGDLDGHNYNIEFSDWIQKDNKEKTSVVWKEFIYDEISKRDDNNACNALLERLLEFSIDGSIA